MKTKYQCEYCFEYFMNESEAKKHENSCPSKQTYKLIKLGVEVGAEDEVRYSFVTSIIHPPASMPHPVDMVDHNDHNEYWIYTDDLSAAHELECKFILIDAATGFVRQRIERDKQLVNSAVALKRGLK